LIAQGVITAQPKNNKSNRVDVIQHLLKRKQGKMHRGNMRTFFVNETAVDRRQRIAGETSRRLASDARKRKYPRCTNCRRRKKSDLHKCLRKPVRVRWSLR